MGNIVIFSTFTKCNTLSIILVGLDAAGKTTILYKLKLGEIVTTIPTIGKYDINALLATGKQGQLAPPLFNIVFYRF